VLTYGHDALPIFSKGSGHDANYWKALVRMALLDGWLYKDIEQYGLLSLTDKGNEYFGQPHQSGNGP
jgi:ATP-dependent DNA helicase RecQ